MHFPSLVLIPNTLHVTALGFETETVTIHARTFSVAARCPLCGQTSSHLHSRYTRTLSDLPWAGTPIRFQIAVRRFHCDNSGCPRKIFAERLDKVAPAYARRTDRQREALLEIAFALGGEAGARLATKLKLGVSPDTLLRYIRSTRESETWTPSVLGVDDWAWRRGHRYGTILVDLERHCVVDLLPDRSVASLSSWLERRPGVRVISRDRGGEYAEGARQGAPNAVQVADRFHLLKNLGEALEKVLKRFTPLVQRVPLPSAAKRAPPPRLDREAGRERTRAKTIRRYETIQAMKATGMSQRAIARILGLHRQTVRRYFEPETVPARPRRASKARMLAPYEAYLLERWRQGCRNGLGLWREIVAMGYPGKRGNVSRFVAHLRRQEGAGALLPEPAQGLTPRQAMGLLLVRPEARSRDQEATIGQLKALDPVIREAVALFDRFARMVRGRTSEQLERWLGDAASSGIAEMEGFVTKLKQDREAVEAALSTEWSQGQVEGQITRLKLIRRQMYGRGKFDLVRKRVLRAA